MESHPLNLPQWTADISQELMLQLGRDAVIVAANPACARVLGYSQAELRSKSFFELVHPEDLEPTRAAMAPAAEGTPFAFANRYRHGDGSYRSFAWKALVDGDRLYVAGIDQTAQRTAPDASREAQEGLRLSGRAETIAQLTRGIIHDFNNSLQSIVAALELVRKLIASGRGNEAERFIAKAISASQRAAALNDRLLGFCHGETTGARPLSLNELIVGLEDMVRRTLPTSITLALELSPQLWNVRCDVEQAEVVVLNLILEARDAIPNGGTITISTCNTDTAAGAGAHAADVAPGEYVCVVVSHSVRAATDSMPEHVMPAATSSGGSESARLRIAARFARENGGDLKVQAESAVGGAIVTHLPRHN